MVRKKLIIKLLMMTITRHSNKHILIKVGNRNASLGVKGRDSIKLHRISGEFLSIQLA
jgi:hypothetical protein